MSKPNQQVDKCCQLPRGSVLKKHCSLLTLTLTPDPHPWPSALTLTCPEVLQTSAPSSDTQPEPHSRLCLISEDERAAATRRPLEPTFLASAAGIYIQARVPRRPRRLQRAGELFYSVQRRCRAAPLPPCPKKNSKKQKKNHKCTDCRRLTPELKHCSCNLEVQSSSSSQLFGVPLLLSLPFLLLLAHFCFFICFSFTSKSHLLPSTV